MEQKKNMLIALIIAVVIAAAVMSSFLLPTFFRKTPSITLPDVSSLTGGENQPDDSQDPFGNSFVRVEITPDTVQSVIETLNRPESYYREMTVERIWGEEEGDRSTTAVQVWTDGGYTRVRAALPSGLVRHCIVGDGNIYLWYGGDKTWYQNSADGASADLAQIIPTYEEVLALQKSDITEAGYVTYDGMSCIYVTAEDRTVNYLRRYWIEVQSGLLVGAETVKDSMLVYRMTADTLDIPVSEDASFELPDGTVLHQVSQT